MIDFTKISKLNAEHFSQFSQNLQIDLKCKNGLPVAQEQIQLLCKNGNFSENWNSVFVTEETDLRRIRNCEFSGEVYIHLPEGKLFATCFESCKIENPFLISSTAKIAKMEIHSEVIIENCGIITWNKTPGVLHSVINAGVETGERSIPILPFFDHNDIWYLAQKEGRTEIQNIKKLQKEIGNELTGIIAKNSELRNTMSIENTVISVGIKITNAGVIRDSILLANSEVKDGALVRDSVLQWNAVADSYAVVENSIVGEYALVERHGKLTDSFLGADSVLGEGEVTASLVGPLTGIHHQCLLIAALWPAGLGNIGYGANIGSNHTSRLPDQEIRIGKGFFFGLSSSVKFPSDFSDSPFTIIATGVTTLPQKLSFPFSLVTSPYKRPNNVPEAYGMLKPGWMLQNNLYALVRNAWKYRNRSKVVHTKVDTDVFSSDTAELVRIALENLQKNHLDKMPGIGKNFLTEADRKVAIDIYSKYIMAFKLWEKYKNNLLLLEEKEKLLVLIKTAKSLIRASREKDFVRGNRIISDYSSVRKRIDEDDFLTYFDLITEKIAMELENE